MIYLIADSGSTKTTWKLIQDSTEVAEFHTSGINPNYLSKDQINTILKHELYNQINCTINKIKFYGSGCAQTNAKEKLKEAFLLFSPKASITIDTDLTAACKAISSDQKAWICILGTGSNSCVYKENKVIHQPLSLGYILGDEGSGQDIGKKLLKAYFSDQMPTALKTKWDQKYNTSYSTFIKKIYQEPKPNTWIASFSTFAKENITSPFIENLVLDSFDSFIKTYIIPQEEYRSLPINFIGSIAFHFQKQLSIILHKYQLNAGIILQSPIEKWDKMK